MTTTFTPKIDLSYRLTAVLSGIAAGLGLWLWLAMGGWLIGSIVTLGGGAAFTVAMAQLLCTSYRLEEGSLEVRSGVSRISVFYDDMLQVTTDKTLPVDGYVPMALSKDAIYLIHKQGQKNYRLELSPADQEGFLELLAQKAPQLCS